MVFQGVLVFSSIFKFEEIDGNKKLKDMTIGLLEGYLVAGGCN